MEKKCPPLSEKNIIFSSIQEIKKNFLWGSDGHIYYMQIHHILQMCQMYAEECITAVEVDSSSSSSSEDSGDEVWSESETECPPADTTLFERLEQDPPHSPRRQVLSITTWLVFILAMWQATYFVSDHSLTIVLTTIQAFTNLLSQQVGSTVLGPCLVGLVPASVYMVRKLLGVDRENFTKYVVCVRCNSIYTFRDCFTVEGQPRLCTKVLFEKGKYSRQCGGSLVRKMTLKGGKTAYYPVRWYPYKSVTNSLEELLCRPGLEEQCREWVKRPSRGQVYGDVYDGKVWKSFQNYKGEPFLDAPNTFGFMINVDWFSPFKRVHVSVGAIYLVLMNLPRHLRFKTENVILLGLIPDLPKEPDSLNSYLEPFVEEMQTLWKGVSLKTHNHPDGINVRAALLGVAADVPATRKLCGFLGHSACYGCSKCLRKFPRDSDKIVYSGFDRTLWPQRNLAQHRRAVSKTLACKSKTGRSKAATPLTFKCKSPYV